MTSDQNAGKIWNLWACLDVVSRRLPQTGVDCLLIGGFAVNHYGYTRNTLDVDFMIVANQLDNVKRVMAEVGFVNVVVSENSVFFGASNAPWRVDFLMVDEDTMQKLQGNAVRARVRGVDVKVPALKDLLAMKIFALSQDVARRLGKDLPDIAWLSVLHKLDLDTDIRPLCDRFGTPAVYGLISQQVGELRMP